MRLASLVLAGGLLCRLAPLCCAASATLVINGTANIYASGRGTAFNGTLPPFARFSPGPSQVVTFSGASGLISCCGGAPDTGPEGSANGGTDISAYRGISGIRNDRRQLFLVGVFLDDTEPADPPPSMLDFTNNMGFTTLSPQLRQVFFVGDGLTGTGSGAAQQFVVPAAATRLFLGFADGWSVRGAPGFYDDNKGSFSITYQIAGGGATCAYTLDPPSGNFTYEGVSGAVWVRTASGCGWTARSNVTWIKITSAESGSGPAIVNYTVETNRTAASRSGTMSIAGQTFTVTQTAWVPCTYTITPGSVQMEAAGGRGTVKLTTRNDCEWTAASNASWITLTTVSKGGFYVDYAVAENPSASARSGAVTIAGLTFTVTQAGSAACAVSLNPYQLIVTPDASDYFIVVSAGSTCRWTVTTTTQWIALTTTSGTGNGVAGFRVSAYSGVQPRVGTIALGGQTFRLTQSGTVDACTYSLSATSVKVAAEGGEARIKVTTPEGCRWTARSEVAWIAVLSGSTGVFLGEVIYRVDRNAAPAARTGTMTIAKQTVTFSQDGAGAASTVEITDVVNDADLTTALAPGGAVFIRGRNFATATGRLDGGVPWPNQLEGVSVEVIDGGRTLAAPVGGLGPGWVTAQLPFGISATVDIRVVTPAGRSAAKTISVAARSPRLYTLDGSGKGAVWAFHADNSEVTASAPAKPGEEILLLGTGFGAVSPAAQAGQLGIDPSRGGEPNRVIDAVEVEIQGIAVRPKLAALDYFLVGVYIVVFTAPEQVTSASPPLLVRVGGAASQRDAILPMQPGAGSPACTYSVTPASAQVPAAGGPGSVSVTAGTACAWTASSNQTWLKVTSGASGTGNGTVRYSADANTSSSARTATLTVAGKAIAITQEGTAQTTLPSCTYTVSPAKVKMAAGGGAGSVAVTGGADCAWDTTGTAAWLKVTAGASGTGNGTVRFTAEAHTAADSRTGYLLIGDQAFAVVQDGYALPPGPSISAGGVVNTADQTADLAPGSSIAVTGLGLATSSKQTAELPWPVKLDGVSVEILQGEQVLYAPVFSVAPEQVRAQLPYGIVGEVRVRVRTSQGVSEPRTVTLAARAPRVFRQEDGAALLRHGDSSVVSRAAPARADETVSLYAEGLGAVAPSTGAGQPGGDDGQYGSKSRVVEPVAVEVNGEPVEVLFAGLAPGEVGTYRIDFKVPAGVGLGTAGVRVKVGDSLSPEGTYASLTPAVRRVWTGSVEPGGTISAPGFAMTFPASVLPRAAEIAVDAAVTGQPVFFVSGLPAGLDGEATVTLETTGELPVAGTEFIMVRDPSGDGTPFAATVEGSRIRANVRLRTGAVAGDTKGRSAGEGPYPELGLMVMHRMKGRTFNGPKNLVRGDAVVDVGLARRPYATSSIPDSLQEIVDAAENAYLAAIATGIPPLPPGKLPMIIKMENHYSTGMARHDSWYSDRPWMRDRAHEDICGTVSFQGIVLDLAMDEKLLRQKVAHLVVERLLQEIDPLYGPSYPWDKRRRPWEWFHEAVAGWFERKACRASGCLFPLTVWQRGAYEDPWRRPPPGEFGRFEASALELTQLAQFPSRSGLDWPNAPWPAALAAQYATDQRVTLLAYGLNAAPWIDFLDSALSGSNPQWLGELYRSAAAKQAFQRAPVPFLRDSFLAGNPGGMNQLWIDFIRDYTNGMIYQDVKPAELARTRNYIKQFGGVIKAGPGEFEPGLLNAARIMEESFPMADYSAVIFVTDALGPYDDKLAKLGRMVVDTKSNTGAVAHISQCSGERGCAYQELPPEPWQHVSFSEVPANFEESWYGAAVIQPGSDAAGRDPVKVRIGVERGVSRDRLMQATGLNCTLEGKFSCTAGDCPTALGIQIRRSSKEDWSCDAATGVCFAKTYSAGSSTNSTANFLLDGDGVLKFLVGVDNTFLDPFTINSSFKLLNSYASDYRGESGEGDTYRVTFTGGEVRERSWVRRSKEGNSTRLTDASFIKVECTFTGVPERRPWGTQ